MKNDSAHGKICAINSEKAVSRLSSDPTVSCSKCGAKAHDPASLCNPVPLTQSR